MKLFRSHCPQCLLIAVILTITGCGTSAPIPVASIGEAESTPESIDDLLASARGRTGSAAAELSIRAMETMLDAGMVERAAEEANSINRPDRLPSELQLRFALLQGDIALRQQQPDLALRWLTGALVRRSANQPQLRSRLLLLTADAYRNAQRFVEAVNFYFDLIDTGRRRDNVSGEFNAADELWNALSSMADADLNQFASSADNYELRGWIELARMVRKDQFSITTQLASIQQWRRVWSRHSAATQLPGPLIELQRTWDQRPRQIALILPLQEAYGNAIQEGFLSAYYQALAISRDVPGITVYDSSGLSTIYSIYNEAVANGADLVIGPVEKELVNQLRRLPELPVPTLALNYADDLVAEPGRLFQFGLAPEDEIEQAAELAWQAGYRNAAIITPDTEDYLRHQATFSEKWAARGGKLVSQATFNGNSDYAEIIKRLIAIDSSEARADRLLDLLPRNNMEFTPRRREDIDFIFLIANPRQGRQIKPTLAFYFAEDIPVYSLPSIYDGADNQSENRDLDGIVFTDAPWLLDSTDPLKSEVSKNLRQTQGPLQRLRAMGIDSFRLYPRLQQMANRQIPNLRGTTGTLTMTENQRIQRNLEVARFVDGIAEPL